MYNLALQNILNTGMHISVALAQCAGDIAALDLPWLGKKHLKGLLGKFTDWRALMDSLMQAARCSP